MLGPLGKPLAEFAQLELDSHEPDIWQEDELWQQSCEDFGMEVFEDE